MATMNPDAVARSTAESETSAAAQRYELTMDPQNASDQIAADGLGRGKNPSPI